MRYRNGFSLLAGQKMNNRIHALTKLFQAVTLFVLAVVVLILLLGPVWPPILDAVLIFLNGPLGISNTTQPEASSSSVEGTL